MIYLSQLTPRVDKQVVREQLQNPYQLHKTLACAYGDARQKVNLLYRIENIQYTPRILVQATAMPNWDGMRSDCKAGFAPNSPPTKSLDLKFHQHQQFRFRLIANPTKKVARIREDGSKWHSKRMPLYKPEQQHGWLDRKASQSGFVLNRLEITQPQIQWGMKVDKDNQHHNIKIYSVQFDGLLTITDADQFQQAWQKGIGPAKAFGCGLLSIGRA